jgi:NAD(P)-dependent dehydrogenase (short-subunit alcohol dehydrogenase family)
MMGRSAAPNGDANLDIVKTRELNYVAADVSDSEAVTQAFATSRSRFGKIEILVNNAGQAGSAPFLKTDIGLWRRMISINLDGTFHCSQAVLPDMLAARWGRVVNIASVAGLAGYAYVSAYCASKHAVIGLTRALALEVAAKGVTVNAVCPGYTESDMVKESLANIVAKTSRTPDQALAELVSRNPQKRLIKPEEVANAVAWLCLPGSEAVTGQAISVSGGELT